MKKTVCIVNYNTTELTRAVILSIRKHGGENYRIVVFDNSDKTQFGAMDGVEVVDNTKGKKPNPEEINTSFLLSISANISGEEM